MRINNLITAFSISYKNLSVKLDELYKLYIRLPFYYSSQLLHNSRLTQNPAGSLSLILKKSCKTEIQENLEKVSKNSIQ